MGKEFAKIEEKDKNKTASSKESLIVTNKTSKPEKKGTNSKKNKSGSSSQTDEIGKNEKHKIPSENQKSGKNLKGNLSVDMGNPSNAQKQDVTPKKNEKIEKSEVSPPGKNITEKADKPDLPTEKLKKNTSKKVNKTGVKRRTRLAPNTRSINTAGVGGSVTKKVKKVKPAIQNEKNTNSDTEAEDDAIEAAEEPKSKKMKLGSKDEAVQKKGGTSKIERRKLSDKDKVKDEEP